MALPVVTLPHDYDEDSGRLAEFLSKSTRLQRGERQWREPAGEQDAEAPQDDLDELDDPDIDALDVQGMDLDAREGGLRYKYKEQLQRIANREQDKLVIDLADIARYQDTATELVSRICGNAKRYVDMLAVEVDKALPAPTKDLSTKDDVIDVIIHQRQEKNAANEENGLAQFPPRLIRRYDLYLRPLPRDPVLAVRDVRGAHIGKLITVRGIVTRVSEVKPKLLVNAFSCDACDSEVFQDVEERSFMPLTQCPSEDCQRDGARGKLHMQTRACKFSPFQEVKIQEMADQVPVGHIPRSMTIHLNGAMARSMTPGDIVHVSGIFLPMPFSSGRAAARIGLLTDTYLEAHHVHQLKKQYEAMQLTPEIERQIEELRGEETLYNKLAASIAPEIYGHMDVKKALLLLLVGGVTKAVGDGMKIRGDINICLMGDPGVAKSQLLKYITKVAPRGVYTTGRGSSGVGLTAAVMRDPVTDEMVLEGGALVLADNGIACIDEFDKMDESDRTAIHEVMEQQTISIAKAGITTTLNARTSILAAANPLYGRYNPKISPVDNINLPAALLSRFDVMFLILDTPTREDDERLAQHVCHVHMHETAPAIETEVVSPLILRHYVATARTKRPTVPKHVSDYIVSAYVQLRANSKEDDARNQSFTYTSARTLLAVLRLSQALARLRNADEVEQPDVDEALRLMSVSKASLMHDDDLDRDQDQTTTSKIYRIIRDMAASGTARRHERKLGRGAPRRDDADAMDEDDGDDDGVPPVLALQEVRDRVTMKGYSVDQLNECLEQYEGLDVLTVDEVSGTLTFV